MLDSQKNKLTVEILSKLKKKGVPPVQSAMTEEDTLMGDAEVVDEEMSPNGEMVRLPLSIRGLSSQKKPKSKAKQILSEDEEV
jgi:hypothetical protein